jgi:BirA family biotin operon repressor/biotin-[acetyl-CoA-carboxylase] ligase
VIADQQNEGKGQKSEHDGAQRLELVCGSLSSSARVTHPGIEVLSIRVGIRAARALDRFAREPIRLKWPNDLYVGGGKLAGILVEARWRESGSSGWQLELE